MKCSCCGRELTLQESLVYYRMRSEELHERSKTIVQQARKEMNDKVDNAIRRMHDLINNI